MAPFLVARDTVRMRCSMEWMVMCMNMRPVTGAAQANKGSNI
jgi:hypothetical protein